MKPLTVLPKVAAVGLAVIVGAVIVLLWRALGFDEHYLIDLTLAGWLLWLHLDRVNVHEKADTATDDADKAIRKADTATGDADRAVRRTEAIEQLLTDGETPSTGRHATPPHLERSQA